MSNTQEESPTRSVDRPDDQPKDEKKTKSRRPPNTAFRQQRLKAWQPILTPKTVLPLFFIVGVIFAPVGGLLLWASSKVQEISIDYTDCRTSAPHTLENMPDDKVNTYLNTKNDQNKPQWSNTSVRVPIGNSGERTYSSARCTIKFYVPNEIKAPVFLYYRLTNFYQNHRRYVKSLDQSQLAGEFVTNTTLKDSECNPLGWDGEKGYYPCGLIANSLFNDTFSPPLWLNPQGAGDRSGQSNETYQMTSQDIAWPSDAELYKESEYTVHDVVPPPHWKLRYPDGYNDEFPLPELWNDDGFQVWMRTAGLPTFSKLALKNTTSPMQTGWYSIDIINNFDVGIFGGTKEILISTSTIMGGRNPFLGIAYVVVGGVCVLLGAVFTATHLIKPRKLGDHTYLSWNNDQPSTATATGRSARPNDPA
ncbi:MAG: hypothetical protein M1831_006989 [Alyxoria varia]|nr:MAG: hypothetical protein M1831_006989 [Alyxoria varia]